MPNKTYETIIPFIREEGLMDLIKVITYKKMTSASIIQAFKKCLTWWVKNTEEGHKAWQDSCGDFNVGDLAMWEDIVNTSMPHSKLTANGIVDWKIIECGDPSDIISFDKILVNYKDLPDDWDKEV